MSADLAKMIQERMIELEETLVTAESCTGGMIGAQLTELSGSSKYYLGGAVVYSNELKMSLLDVPPAKLNRFGAVSKPVAKAMALGAQRNLGSDWAVAVTGIAGPKSDDTEKPVGLVYIAVAGPGDIVKVEKKKFEGGRADVRQQTVERALGLLWEMIQ